MVDSPEKNNLARHSEAISTSMGDSRRKECKQYIDDEILIFTCGAAIPPILATRLHVPSAADRTTVGNSSVVYKKIMLNEAAIPNRPTNATAVCAAPCTTRYTIRHWFSSSTPKDTQITNNFSIRNFTHEINFANYRCKCTQYAASRSNSKEEYKSARTPNHSHGNLKRHPW